MSTAKRNGQRFAKIGAKGYIIKKYKKSANILTSHLIGRRLFNSRSFYWYAGLEHRKLKVPLDPKI
jgi:hypothetical protein